MEISDLEEVSLFLLMAFASQKHHLLTLKAKNNGFKALCISSCTSIYEDGGQLVHILVILVFQKQNIIAFQRINLCHFGTKSKHLA